MIFGNEFCACFHFYCSLGNGISEIMLSKPFILIVVLLCIIFWYTMPLIDLFLLKHHKIYRKPYQQPNPGEHREITQAWALYMGLKLGILECFLFTKWTIEQTHQILGKFAGQLQWQLNCRSGTQFKPICTDEGHNYVMFLEYYSTMWQIFQTLSSSQAYY